MNDNIMHEQVHVSTNGQFVDSKGRIIQLRGVNLDPCVKVPKEPYLPTHDFEQDSIYYEKAGNVGFKGHPMPLEEIEAHVKRIKSLGYNTIRFLFSWETIEHEGPGVYDYEYMDFAIEFLQGINKIGGLYVYLDPHQDVWSRCCGGSGAPLWTLYCAGFQPTRFEATGASVLHNHFSRDGRHYPKMLWPTNYFKLASQTMFTLFFAGKEFAPKCTINGMNIQEYLQERFISAVMIFYERIQKKAPELFKNNCIIGLETMNEPNHGYLGERELGVIPKERSLRRGLTPTAFQCFKMGHGYHAHVDNYDLSIFGPSKNGNIRVDPKGERCWLTQAERDEIDSQYHWKRGEEWLAGQCIWKLHGVWTDEGNRPKLLKPNYFAKSPLGQIVDDYYFANYYFLDFYKLFRSKFRDLDSERLLFMQSPVFKTPPELGKQDLLDGKTVCACHFYDGMSLMFKTWNKLLNVDTFGVVRGKYSNPAFSVVFGENSIRKSLRKQLGEMVKDVHSAVGKGVPVFFTEIGMPFDMNHKRAYENGDYSAQIAALDALGFALEGNNLSYSLWCYCHKNSHKWGDLWNNEDFSIWSREDTYLAARDPNIKLQSSDDITFAPNAPHVKVSHIPDLLDPPSVKRNYLDFSGIRSLSALLRPFPIKIDGKFKSAEFILNPKRYVLEVIAEKTNSQSYIFLPSYHFPLKELVIDSSSRDLILDPDYGVLKWQHGPGRHYLVVSVESETSKGDECVIV